MSKPKVFIADPVYTLDHSDLGPIWPKFLKKFDVITNSTNRTLAPKELISLAKDCVAIVAGSEIYSQAVLKSLPNLRCISRTGAGLEKIDLAFAASKNILICHAGSVMAEPTAELAIGLVFSLLRKIPMLNTQMHAGIWGDYLGLTLAGKTVGIIGAGRVGKIVAEIMQKFGCQVLANKKHPDATWSKKTHIPFVSLAKIYAKSDIICIFLPGTKENTHLINKIAFAKMKPGVILVNVGRGNVISENDLIAALRSGKVSKAALDVFEHEPKMGELRKFQNVILTPHVGGATKESRQASKILALENVLTNL